MRLKIFLSLLLAGITLGLYWPARHFDLIYFDDPLFVSDSPEITSGLNAHSLIWAFTNVVAANWHPITNLTFLLTHQFWGVNPGVEHLVNALFHSANAALLFWLLQRITGAPGRSLAVAAIFAWHPLRVESVAWIAERKDVVSGFFFLLALLAYAHHAQPERTANAASQEPVNPPELPWFRSPGYLFALGFFALGLMSKAMLVTLPFILLLLDAWPFRRVEKFNAKDIVPLVVEKIPFFVLVVIFCALTYDVQQGGAIMTYDRAGLDARAGNIVASYWRYLYKTVWPHELAIQYPFPTNDRSYLALWPAAEIVAGAAALLLVAILCTWQWTRRPYLAVGWLWFLGMLVPVIGIIQVGGQGMADRYTYLPLIGPVIALVWLAAEAFKATWQRCVLTGIAGVALLACACWTERQLNLWRDTVTLFEHTVEVTGDNHLAQMILANGYEHQKDLSRAMVHDRIAIALAPEDHEPILDLARLLAEKMEWSAAIDTYDQALAIDENDAPARLGLASVLSRQGRAAEANEQLEALLQFDPDSTSALNNLAWALATSADAHLRDGPRAVQLAEHACELTHYQKTVFIGTLAAAYAEAGRYEEAINAAQKAVNLAKKNGETGLRTRNEELLGLYQQHHAYHEAASGT